MRSRDVQIICPHEFRPLPTLLIFWSLVQYLGPCTNGNEAVEEMSRSVKICILNWKLTLIHNISCDIFQLKNMSKVLDTVLTIGKKFFNSI